MHLIIQIIAEVVRTSNSKRKIPERKNPERKISERKTLVSSPSTPSSQHDSKASPLALDTSSDSQTELLVLSDSDSPSAAPLPPRRIPAYRRPNRMVSVATRIAARLMGGRVRRPGLLTATLVERCVEAVLQEHAIMRLRFSSRRITVYFAVSFCCATPTSVVGPTTRWNSSSTGFAIRCYTSCYAPIRSTSS